MHNGGFILFLMCEMNEVQCFRFHKKYRLDLSSDDLISRFLYLNKLSMDIP